MHKSGEHLRTWTNAETRDLKAFIQHQTAYCAHVAARFEHADYREQRRHYLRTSLAAKYKALTIIIVETAKLKNNPEQLTKEKLTILDKASRLCDDPRFDLPRTIATITDKDLAWSKDAVDINISKVLQRVHKFVDVSELQSAGYMGLAEAICKYNPEQGTRFTSFASYRIRGSIIDYLRSLDPLARSARIKLKQGIESSELTRQHAVAQPLSLEECLDVVHPHSTFPEDTDAFEKMIAFFPQKIRKLLTLRYSSDLTMDEIGKQLDMTESRVCQLHAKAIKALQEKEGIIPQKRYAGVNHSALRYSKA